ncbi:hypothetical protein BSL78_05409 [Apostichopus japonicus]|uniref:ZP domain-containing protein n=1 Tax=Stichopus japonicus TaxID=307972 RepID=A0A2G8LBR6_STIJA|nr:hypothetical protein BSL78_05409 [Apostichopus japonicus]
MKRDTLLSLAGPEMSIAAMYTVLWVLTAAVELFFRLAYRHGFFSDPETSEVGEDCTHEAIRTKNPIPTGGEFTAIVTTFENGERIEDETELFDGMPPYYTCTNIKDSGSDVDLHWASGYNRTIITLPEQENDGQVWSVGYDACCWLSELVNYESPRSWRLRTKVDLAPRSDLDGRSNTSPYVEGLPMKTVAQDCITAIPINAIDQDGDRVSCRWTSGRKGECDDPNCGNPNATVFTMKSANAHLPFPTRFLTNALDKSIGGGLWKDFFDNPLQPSLLPAPALPDPALRRCECCQCQAWSIRSSCYHRGLPKGRRRRAAFSKISYQFLVNIQRRNVECNRVVTEAPEKACYAVPFVLDPPFTIELHAQTTDPSVPIVTVDMITQPGMVVSDLHNDGNGRYHVEVSWIPTADKLGNVEQLCYQAVDAENIAGQEICLKLFVGGSTPEPIPERSYPSSNESEIIPYFNQIWELHFTEKVQLGDADTLNAAVVFLLENGTVAYAVTLNDNNLEVNVTTEEPYYVSFHTQSFTWTRLPITPSDWNLVPSSAHMGATSPRRKLNGTSQQLPAFRTITYDVITFISLSAAPQRALLQLIDQYPEVASVECLPTFMVTYIEREAFPDIDPSILSYEDPDCYGIIHNETHLALGTMYGKCGTRAIVNEDQTRVSMINTIFLPPIGTFIFDGVLTRSKNSEVQVNCSIPTRRVGYVEFETNSSTVVTKKDEVGDFGYSLKLFPDEDYRRPYRVWDFPVSVQSNSRLHFEARTYTSEDFSPFLQECVATPTDDPRSSLRYVIIREGCPEDETIIFHYNHPSSKRIRFSIEAFSFIGYNLQSSIFVHCDIRDCNPLNGSCDTNCPEPEVDPNLSKRSVSSLRTSSGDENN